MTKIGINNEVEVLKEGSDKVNYLTTKVAILKILIDIESIKKMDLRPTSIDVWLKSMDSTLEYIIGHPICEDAEYLYKYNDVIQRISSIKEDMEKGIYSVNTENDIETALETLMSIIPV